MNKKKILVLAMTLSMVAILAMGATLAYFTDVDNVTNTFTTGNVNIEIEEVFEQDSELIPGIDVEKDVFVKNTGTKDAYVRVHIAVPKILDSGDPEFAAYANTLHWNFTRASIEEGQWNWNESVDGAYYPGNGGAWNSYETTIDGVDYTVYVATYMTALASGAKTATESLTKVYLDTSVTNESLAEILEEIGTIKIHVVAEGGQVDGFANAYDALNTQFGVPGTAGYDPFN